MSTKIIDVHLHRDPYVGKVWDDTVQIMRRVFPEDKVQDFIAYKEEFIKRLKKWIIILKLLYRCIM